MWCTGPPISSAYNLWHSFLYVIFLFTSVFICKKIKNNIVCCYYANVVANDNKSAEDFSLSEYIKFGIFLYGNTIFRYVSKFPPRTVDIFALL